MDGSDKNRAICCPRCGYDQRGVVAAWINTCPLYATCAECGLSYCCAEIVSPKLQRPQWCVEFSSSWRELPKRSLQTLLMMARPWRFWDEIKMAHEFRPRRVALIYLSLALLIYVCMASRVGIVMGQSYSGVAAPLEMKALSVAYSIAFPYTREPPSWFVNSGWTLGTKRVAGVNAPVPRLMAPADCARGMPLYFSLKGLMQIVVTRDFNWFRNGPAITAALYVTLLIPFCFLALPVSRQMAMVRWVHIGRVAAYSLVPLLLIILYDFLTQLIHSIPIRMLWNAWSPTYYVRQWLPWPGIPVFLCIWWGFAIGRYLKIAHAWAIAISMVMMSTLFFTLIVALITLVDNL